MRYLSLFSGIGGFELGIQNALSKTERKQQGGTEVDSSMHGQKQLGAQCVGYSEIDKYAVQIYQKHFPEHHNYGDITKIKEDELPDFDLLVGGFPCQSFSIAGKRGGFSDTRGTLFFDIARILKQKQPRLLLLENVKGLLSHDKGATFLTIIRTLDELGYDLQWQVLNSKNFGVPQNRERVFIVGHLRGTSRPEVFPIANDGGSTDELPRHVANTLTRRYEGAQAVGTYIGEGKLDAQIKQIRGGSQGNRVYEPRGGLSVTLASQAGGMGAKTGLYSTGDMKIRRLTPTECARLQGFPDNWHEGVSDTQAYKCYGNAVTVNVVAEIVKRLSTSPQVNN